MLAGRVFWLTLMSVCLLCGPAWGWVTTGVTSSVTTIEVQPGGTAKVSHEWLIRVRGGPLKSWTVDGVDEDAVLVEDATITRASSGRVAGVPIPLKGQKNERSLHFTLTYKKGVRTGSYLVRFSYLTDLLAQGAIRSAGPVSAVEWQSPLYPDGIDSLKVNFVFRRGVSPPMMPGEADPTLTPDEGDIQIVSTDQGVFLSELRREAGSDVLSLTRPHVAKFEQVTWRALVDPTVVGLQAEPISETKMLSPPAPRAEKGIAKPLWPYAIAAAFSLCFSALLLLKLRSSDHKPLVNLRRRYRLPVVASLLAASVWLALVLESPTVAALALFGALALSITRPATPVPSVRGPGAWKAVSARELTAVFQEQSRSSRWLDVGSLPGFLLFALLLGGFVVLGLRLLGVSPYYSAMALLYATSLVPLFCTIGGARCSVVSEQLTFLEPLLSRLPRSVGRLELWARFPQGRDVPDELRLRCMPAAPRPGFRSCEVALEQAQGALGNISTPALLLRVEEHSEAHRQLPRNAQWSRGRYPEERVAVIRPVLPLRAVTVELLMDVLRKINHPKRPRTRSAA